MHGQFPKAPRLVRDRPSIRPLLCPPSPLEHLKPLNHPACSDVNQFGVFFGNPESSKTKRLLHNHPH